MKEETRILERYGRQGPWKVPEGYFDAVRVEIASRLPEYPAAPRPQKLGIWQRVKPYAYLAAMFAGIWCMMQVFHHAAGSDSLSLDNPPAQIAELMADPEMDEFMLVSQSVSDDQLIDEVSGNYNSIEDFERDFGVEIEPRYDKIEL